MRVAHVGLCAVLVLLVSGCGEGTPPVAVLAAAPSPSTMSLPCDEGRQTQVALDIAGPGRPSPEEAVAPFAATLTLVTQKHDGRTTVAALGPNETVLRMFEVSQHQDGWWPDGYRECRRRPGR